MQVDGQLKTGRDVVIAALLGAEEFGFATAPLVVSGCVMMRVCHLDTCPVGVATQNPELRKRFSGKPEFVVNFFEFIAEEVREHLAALGFRSARRGGRPGRAARHRAAAMSHWKAAGLDLAPVLHVAGEPERPAAAGTAPREQDHGLDKALDNTLIALAEGAPRRRAGPPRAADPQRQPHRRHHARPRGDRRYGGEGLPDAPSTSRSPGRRGSRSARSCRAASPCGWTATRTTTSARACPAGGSSCCPHRSDSTFEAERNVIAGNVIAYGATTGEVFLRGTVGERFCVRNSGAPAVVEGVGDHGCEYMTGGRVVVLGADRAQLRGGHVRRHRLRARPRSRDSTPRWSTSTRSEPDDRDRCTTWCTSTTRKPAPRSPDAARRLGRGGGRFTKVMPNDYKRVLERHRRAEPERAVRSRDDRRIMEATHG